MCAWADGPAVGRRPLGAGVQTGSCGDEARARRSFGNIVVLRVRERLYILSVRFDRGRFNVSGRIGMMRVDEADVIEEKLIAAGRAELAAFFEQDADLGRSAVVVVGQDLDNDWHF